MSDATTPSLDYEDEFFASGHRLVAGLDEVGTGSAAGPCYCALAVLDASRGLMPGGLKDSKLLTPARREALVEPLNEWLVDWATGSASADEIDRFGLTAALRLAGHRALEGLRRTPDIIILDGKRDWLSRPERSELLAPDYGDVVVPAVVTRIKADRSCASVAAASVMAKVERDAWMNELDTRYPGYGWRVNKGYATAVHMAAMRALGLSAEHRRSWKLPGAIGS